MHFLILGGNGRTGRLVIACALARNHTITALVRNPTTLQPRPGLTIVTGNPLSQDDISTAFTATPTSPAAVIITLSAPRASDSPFAVPAAPPRLMADCSANAVAVMKAHGVRKIVTLSALGVGDSFASLPFVLKLLFRKSNMSYQFADHDLVDKETKESGLDYVLVRPAMLTDGEARQVRELGERGEGVKLFDKISRESVARFLVDKAEEGETGEGKGKVKGGRTVVIVN
ncbi:NAD(P)-binding protein [Lepidopterella palustris CBS 459.81]|uniref:NAD(P)-binding protein n=1 Tax=Lepidopterella palustris CBS 459.81 TaxID=1314670 RepID=A0A8E2E7B7_9PEZI|nr:NAD(P)-binding protein [Lepidopterella palustris CBS 459.81]